MEDTSTFTEIGNFISNINKYAQKADTAHTTITDSEITPELKRCFSYTYSQLKNTIKFNFEDATEDQGNCLIDYVKSLPIGVSNVKTTLTQQYFSVDVIKPSIDTYIYYVYFTSDINPSRKYEKFYFSTSFGYMCNYSNSALISSRSNRCMILKKLF